MKHGRKIAVIGLGYVGLPVAVSFARAGVPVVGFDIDAMRVAELRQGTDRTREVDVDDLRHPSLAFTADPEALKESDFYIVTVPTPIEEDCVPVLAETSGLVPGVDFTVGYSPERINPGDKQHRFETITKVVSAQDAKTLGIVAAVYGSVVTAGIHRAPSIKVAEAAKVIENTQRDLNNAFMN